LTRSAAQDLNRSTAVDLAAPASPDERDHLRGFAEYYEANREAPIYVILGVQGSGTNLFGRLMTSLFGVSVMRDRSAVFNAAARLGPNPGRKDVEREIRAFKELVWPSTWRKKISKSVMRRNRPMAGLEDVLIPSAIRSGADFARLIYTYRAYGLGASYLAIKSDDLWENLGRIDEIIPNRRVILLTRDFRDNLLSVGGKQFGPIEPLCAAQYVKHQLAYYIPEFRKTRPLSYHVTYEALLNDTRQVADDLARHFGLVPAVDLDAAVPALKFRPNKIGKWKRLPARELAWCEGILRDELLEFGYTLASDATEVPGSARMLLATVRDKVRRVPQKLRRTVTRLRS